MDSYSPSLSSPFIKYLCPSLGDALWTRMTYVTCSILRYAPGTVALLGRAQNSAIGIHTDCGMGTIRIILKYSGTDVHLYNSELLIFLQILAPGSIYMTLMF
jgi:hypothetical protein